MEKNKFTHGSLFSGIGGPEIAAEEMGWKNMFHCEINPFGRKILDYWFPNSKSYEDITKTNFTEWRGKINVLTGGFPCQPFSCVMASQQDIYNISVQEPERISYIAGLEQQFNSSFFGPDKISSKYYKGEYPLISDVVRYVQSKRAGGSLFDDDVATSCMSYYGLCE